MRLLFVVFLVMAEKEVFGGCVGRNEVPDLGNDIKLPPGTETYRHQVQVGETGTGSLSASKGLVQRFRLLCIIAVLFFLDGDA